MRRSDLKKRATTVAPTVCVRAVRLYSLDMHFRDAAACRAAILAGGVELDWSDKIITDQDAEWIASALADPAVRVFQQQMPHGMTTHMFAHASLRVPAVIRHVNRGCNLISPFEADF